VSTPHAIADWLHTCNARRLCTDSRQVAAGDAFIAWPGYASDARAYVGQAFKAGAVAVLVEADGLTYRARCRAIRGCVLCVV
jgi:MurE/MurF fusion protein